MHMFQCESTDVATEEKYTNLFVA